MTPETKTKAIEKLKKLGKGKIGYPEKWRDYSSVSIARDDFARQQPPRRPLRGASATTTSSGKPVDSTEWGMTPPTVNAYYSPQSTRSCSRPASCSRRSSTRQVDDAVNFGGIGAVIGHELTHGFDDQGRKFDGEGNLDGLVDGGRREGVRGARRLRRGPVLRLLAVNDPKTGKPAFLNGKLTLGENIADNGGVRIAFMALQNTLKGKDRTSRRRLHPEQRFFLGFAQVWCQNVHRRRRAAAHRHRPALVRPVPRPTAPSATCRSSRRRSAARRAPRWRRRSGAGCGR